ncbi:MAG: hypothetical protein LBH52_04830 [Puniceicoccales bacterium]|nr:hypothetical protein [Puniceicoccales bacterium]
MKTLQVFLKISLRAVIRQDNVAQKQTRPQESFKTHEKDLGLFFQLSLGAIQS